MVRSAMQIEKRRSRLRGGACSTPSPSQKHPHRHYAGEKITTGKLRRGKRKYLKKATLGFK